MKALLFSLSVLCTLGASAAPTSDVDTKLDAIERRLDYLENCLHLYSREPTPSTLNMYCSATVR